MTIACLGSPHIRGPCNSTQADPWWAPCASVRLGDTAGSWNCFSVHVKVKFKLVQRTHPCWQQLLLLQHTAAGRLQHPCLQHVFPALQHVLELQHTPSKCGQHLQNGEGNQLDLFVEMWTYPGQVAPQLLSLRKPVNLGLNPASVAISRACAGIPSSWAARADWIETRVMKNATKRVRNANMVCQCMNSMRRAYKIPAHPTLYIGQRINNQYIKNFNFGTFIVLQVADD